MRRARAAAVVVLLFAAARTDAKAARFEVGSSPAVELEGVLQMLGQPPRDAEGFRRLDDAYGKAALESFSKLKEHPAVRLNAELSTDCFQPHARIAYLTRLSAPPELKDEIPPEVSPGCQAVRAKLPRWTWALRDFSKKGDFAGFFARTAPLRKPYEDALRAGVDKTDFIGAIESYSGMTFRGRYQVFVSPFRAPAVANDVAKLPGGARRIATVLGPDARGRVSEEYPLRDLGPIVWHELSHALLDDSADEAKKTLEKSEAAYKRLTWSCYGDWRTCVKEHVVRAVMIRLVARSKGAEAAERQLKTEGEGKFPYLRAMVGALRDRYETDRKKYPTLKAFYPRLLDVLPSH